MNAKANFFFALSILLSSVTIIPAQAENSNTVRSLDEITSQSSDIPALLTSEPIMPLSPVVPEVKKTKRHVSKSSASAQSAGAVNTLYRTAQTEKIAELNRELTELKASMQLENNNLRQNLVEAQRKLDEKRDQTQFPAGNSKDASASLLESQKQIDTLKEQLTKLTAEQTMNKLEFAKARTGDSAQIEQLSQLLTASHSEVDSLNNRVKYLLAAQEESTKALTSAKASDTKNVSDLKESLADSQKEAAALKTQVTTLTATRSDGEKALVTAQQSLIDTQKKLTELESKWRDASSQMEKQSKELADLHATKPTATVTAAPKSKEDMQSYALGTLWGQQVVAALSKMRTDGFTIELSHVISGVNDSIGNQYKIPKEKIIEELDTLNKKELTMSGASAKATKSDDNKFIANFSNMPNTKRADMGYYYRITQKGQGKIMKSDIVDVAVKESLSSGKVINDMNKNGKKLALPLDHFPPLFSTAISLIGNKGKMEIVVPPELAYGDQGQPPEIPPGSTMVYEITVLDVKTQ